jgi:hypothetical protein
MLFSPSLPSLASRGCGPRDAVGASAIVSARKARPGHDPNWVHSEGTRGQPIPTGASCYSPVWRVASTFMGNWETSVKRRSRPPRPAGCDKNVSKHVRIRGIDRCSPSGHFAACHFGCLPLQSGMTFKRCGEMTIQMTDPSCRPFHRSPPGPRADLDTPPR